MKWIRSRCRIRSLYIKWILLFTGLIVFAQLLTLALATKLIIPDMVEKMSSTLYKQAQFVQRLYSDGYELSENTLNDLSYMDIRLVLYDDSTLEGQRDKYGLTDEMLKALNGKEVVSAVVEYRFIDVPCYFVKLGDEIALFTFMESSGEFLMLVEGIQTSILLGAFIGSVLIVVALAAVIKPIKNVAQATKEVAKGNFNISLKTKSIDEIGQLVDNFNLMILELKKNEYLRKDFVASVSHEFKTPLTSIEGFARLIHDQRAAPEENKEYAEIIMGEARRLTNLSSNLLKLSLLDSGAFEISKDKFYLGEQIRRVILMLEWQWAEKNIKPDIVMDEVMFCGNEEMLYQVWVNLIQNAIKFSPENETIEIRLTKGTSAITFEINNKGDAIPAQHQEEIFSRFYKVDKSRSKEGNGLGLSIVKRIVGIYKGTVTLTSSSEAGTTFRVTLPY